LGLDVQGGTGTGKGTVRQGGPSERGGAVLQGTHDQIGQNEDPAESLVKSFGEGGQRLTELGSEVKRTFLTRYSVETDTVQGQKKKKMTVRKGGKSSTTSKMDRGRKNDGKTQYALGGGKATYEKEKREGSGVVACKKPNPKGSRKTPVRGRTHAN